MKINILTVAIALVPSLALSTFLYIDNKNISKQLNGISFKESEKNMAAHDMSRKIKSSIRDKDIKEDQGRVHIFDNYYACNHDGFIGSYKLSPKEYYVAGKMTG